MTREQLLKKKLGVDSALQVAKAALANARRNAGRTGEYLSPEAFNELEYRCKSLSLKSQYMQAELSKMKAAEKADNIAKSADANHRFVKIARRRLDPDLWEEIMDEATKITVAIGGARV